MNEKQIISDNLKKYRSKTGLNQTQVAEKLGVNAQSYSAWERKISEPNIYWLVKLAQFFGVLVDDLVGSDSWVSIETSLPPQQDGGILVRIFAIVDGNKINAVAIYNKKKFHVDSLDVTKHTSHWRSIPLDPIK